MPSRRRAARRALALLVVTPLACSAPPPAAPAASPGEAALRELSLDLDRGVDPCEDFYAYACGGWLAHVERPPHEPRVMRSFTTVLERNRQVLRAALEAAAAEGAPDGVYYASCLDEAAVEARGAAPLAPWLAEIDRVDDAAGFMRMAGRLQRVSGAAPLVQVFTTRDAREPQTWLATVEQGELGLPDRSHYLDPSSAPLRDIYRRGLARLFDLAGEPLDAADADARRVLDFETEVARRALPREALRDADATYHPMSASALVALTPSLPWAAYLAGLGHPDVSRWNAANPDYLRGLAEVVPQASPETLRAFLRAQLLLASAPLLSSAFREENLTLQQAVTGQRAERPRWQQCLAATTVAFPERVGQRYVATMFGAEGRAAALDVVRRVEAAFGESLAGQAWMDAPTREAALAKLHRVGNRIGNPERFRPEAIAVDPGTWFENTTAAAAFSVDREFARAGKPVDPDEWDVPASLVNAFYSATANEMVFPAGILQPPFFHAELPPALDYGAMGMVMGHELSHGFDDQGRKYDAEGRLAPWWSDESAERFQQRASCLVDQYAAYRIGGTPVNGKLTLGENIADLGGIEAAHRAWSGLHDPRDAAAAAETGLTPDQLFFVGFGQIWCTDSAPEYEALLLRVDPHSPPRFRVNGVVRNVPAFAEAFSCKPGAPLAPVDRCAVW